MLGWLRNPEECKGGGCVNNKIIVADALQGLAMIQNDSINTCVTSPPYFGLRDYGTAGQIGIEETPEEYIAKLIAVFREVYRVLRPDGTLWVNIGDSYVGSGKGAGDPTIGKRNLGGRYYPPKYTPKTHASGCKPKDLIGIPWLLAFALRADGWYLRQDIIWHKPNAMPESVIDRPTSAHEHIFLLSKQSRYYYDHESIREPAICRHDKRAGFGRLHYRGKRNGKKGQGQESFVKIQEWRNKRNVWTIATQKFKGAHFATFPKELIRPCILAGSPEGGMVLDPFMGSGTTAIVAMEELRDFIGIEINPEYAAIAEKRVSETYPQLKLPL